uniref:zinc-binding dehydrogenase n=2 Tax=Bacteroidota/Chlorobiota group TaxID=68336 RepID=UPI00404AC833
MEISNEPLKYGQVLVKIFFSGVCRSQLMEMNGARGEDKYLPHLMGHEATGEVVEIGSGVSKVVKGDKVILTWIKGLGINSVSPKYLAGDETINSGLITTFSEYSVISENRIIKIPKGLPLDVGILFGCALQTGAGMVFNELKPNSNESIVVIGLGGIGFSALMALSQYQCKQIIAVDISEQKLALARKFGATHLINSQYCDVKDEIIKLTDTGADGCIESAGSIETIEIGFSVIKKSGGRLYFASHPREGEFIRIAPHDLISGKQIFGSWGGGCSPDYDIPRLATSYFSGQFPLQELIKKRYRLEDINEALDDLKRGDVFRPLIEM